MRSPQCHADSVQAWVTAFTTGPVAAKIARGLNRRARAVENVELAGHHSVNAR
jgi:hypothetical protein